MENACGVPALSLPCRGLVRLVGAATIVWLAVANGPVSHGRGRSLCGLFQSVSFIHTPYVSVADDASWSLGTRLPIGTVFHADAFAARRSCQDVQRRA